VSESVVDTSPLTKKKPLCRKRKDPELLETQLRVKGKALNIAFPTRIVTHTSREKDVSWLGVELARPGKEHNTQATVAFLRRGTEPQLFRYERGGRLLRVPEGAVKQWWRGFPSGHCGSSLFLYRPGWV